MNDSRKTESVCPTCLQRIPARRVVEGEDVYLVKDCPEHGRFQIPIWRGRPLFDSWRRPKIPTRPPVVYREKDRGCPFDCGLCPDHRQRSCTIILEVTHRCNLNCPVCYADSGENPGPDPSLETIGRWYRSARHAGGECNIQLSGGEPTLRDDLPEIVRLGRETGFSFIQVNTNGLRFGADDGFVRDLKAAGLDSIFLQFDGTDDRIYRQMRGRAVLSEKLAAIEACRRHRIGVVLVPTLVPGINLHDVGNLLRRAVDLSPVVRGIHFQPVSYFGRFPSAPTDKDRLTLPELMRAIEEQTDGAFQAAHFQPPGCENALCSFHANYLVERDGRTRPLAQSPGTCCCSEPEKAEVGAARAIASVARQWSAPEEAPGQKPEKAEKPCCVTPGLTTLDDFLARARTHTLSVSAMAFQDAWNLDLERLRDCCIHIMAENGELKPFCAYNLTGSDGRRLYRTT